jgi:putative heme-binding domain-containing protein
MKRIALLILPLTGTAILAFRANPVRQAVEFTVPEGFAVEEVYAPERAGTVVSFTFDSDGNLVVARENGPLVTLLDGNGDGVIDAERPLTDSSTVLASQGFAFDGPDLLVSGRSREGTGLHRVTDTNGDGLGDRVELIELSTGGIQEHGPHAVFFGPDGYLYWTHGNFSNIYSHHSPLSPVREWENASLLGRDDARGFGSAYTGGPGGNFIRKDLSRFARASAGGGQGGPGGGGPGGGGRGAAASRPWELHSLGFRNQYDGAFNLMGELFTFDSDMEWHRDAPWYRPTRTIHAVPGGDFGYREGSHTHPEYYFDNAPAIEGQGRGSPTGVIVYNSYNYPREYWDMVLQADWSRGRIVGSRITKQGASYRSESSNFVYGEPLNVTDVEVGPDGNVYFTLGGRNTAGGIYRVVYRGPNAMQRPAAATPLDRVLTLPQPRSAFSRQAAREVKQELGDAAWQQALTTEARNGQASPERRVRALELLQVFGPGIDDNTLVPLSTDPAWEVRAAVAYYLGMKTSPTARRQLVALLKDSDPFVQRRAAEGLLRTGLNPTIDAPLDARADVFPLLASDDRFVRYAGRLLLQAIDPNQWAEAAFTLDEYPAATEALMAHVEILDNAQVWDITRIARRELELLRANPSEPALLDLVRLIQRTTLKDHNVRNYGAAPSTAGVGALPPAGAQPAQGGGGGGGQGAGPGSVHTQMGQLLLARFPAADTAVNREIARLLSYWQVPGTISKLTDELDNPSISREQQIHYAEMASAVDEEWQAESVERMAAWLEKVYKEDWRGGASFGGAINRLRDDFLGYLPASQQTALTRRLEAAQPQALAAAAPGQGGRGQANVSEEELFEELVYNPNVNQGAPAGGVVAYEQALCSTCHTFGPIGREFGPDLTTINQRFTRRDLVRAVVFPHETVSDLWQVEAITRTNGQTVSGTIYREDASSVVVQIPGTTQQVTIPKSQIRSRTRSEVSPMPAGLLNRLNGQQRRDLFLLLEAGPGAIPDSALSRLGASR